MIKDYLLMLVFGVLGIMLSCQAKKEESVYEPAYYTQQDCFENVVLQITNITGEETFGLYINGKAYDNVTRQELDSLIRNNAE